MTAVLTKQAIDMRQQELLSELQGFREQLLSKYLVGLATVLGFWLILDALLSPPSGSIHLLWIPSIGTLALSYVISHQSYAKASRLLIAGLVVCCWVLVAALPRELTVAFSAIVVVIVTSLMGRWASLLVGLISWVGGLLVFWLAVPAGPSSDLILSSGMVYVFMLGVSWISQSPMREAANLTLTAWEHLRSSLLEARERRVELHRIVRALEEATYRIERMNNELMLARRRAEVARENKARFAAMVSHELRGPLNLILGYSRLLALSPEQYGVPLPPPYRKDVHTIYSSSRHVVNLLDDILDLSQVEVDRMPLVKEHLDLREVISEAERVVRPLAERKGLDLSIEMEPQPMRVFADRVRIRQVLINLLTNATRFTERGRIEVHLSSEDDHVLVCVRDTGRGIPSSDIPRLFEEFSQLHLQDEHVTKGSGLGLAISRHLIRLHDGNIWARSKEGAGTEVYFTLPKLPHERTIAKAPGKWSVSPLPRTHDAVLVVAEDPAVVRLIARHLGEYRTMGIPDLETVTTAVQDHHPRAVVADREVAEAIREKLISAGMNVPVLGCSMPSSKGSSRLEGVFAFLVKPVSRETLERTIRQVPPQGEELVVLVVDDDPEAVRLLAIMLSSLPEPCRILRAYDGTEALATMRRERPDLVLMDLLMPTLSGDDAVRQMQADPRLRTIPVAVISASDALGPSATFGDYLGLFAPSPMDMAEGVGCLRALLDRLAPQYLSDAGVAQGSQEAARV